MNTILRMQPSSFTMSLDKPTLFSQLGSSALEQVSRAGLAGKSYIPLSGLFHVCACLYETGAILGRLKQNIILELLSMSFACEDIQYCLIELRRLLLRRLETSGRYAHSFYTFYLHGTMRDMDMNIDVNAMREAHRSVRDKSEVGDFLEYAGSEGLLLGGWYPNLAEKMYGREYGAQEEVINEMIRGTPFLSEVSILTSILEREKLILNKVGLYVSQYHPELVDELRLMDNSEYQLNGKRPISE